MVINVTTFILRGNDRMGAVSKNEVNKDISSLTNLYFKLPCSKISNLLITPWLLHRVFVTSSGEMYVI